MRFKGVGHMVPQWNNKGGTKLVNYLLFGQKPWFIQCYIINYHLTIIDQVMK
jgi:hypothetical protein